jgi:hypothetical protein
MLLLIKIGIYGLDLFSKRIDAYRFLKEKYYPNLIHITSCRILIGYYILAKEAYLLIGTNVNFIILFYYIILYYFIMLLFYEISFILFYNYFIFNI